MGVIPPPLFLTMCQSLLHFGVYNIRSEFSRRADFRLSGTFSVTVFIGTRTPVFCVPLQEQTRYINAGVQKDHKIAQYNSAEVNKEWKGLITWKE